MKRQTARRRCHAIVRRVRRRRLVERRCVAPAPRQRLVLAARRLLARVERDLLSARASWGVLARFRLRCAALLLKLAEGA